MPTTNHGGSTPRELAEPGEVLPTLTIEQPLTLSSHPKKTVRLRGRIRRIERGMSQLGLSDEDLSSLMPE